MRGVVAGVASVEAAAAEAVDDGTEAVFGTDIGADTGRGTVCDEDNVDTGFSLCSGTGTGTLC